jgi:ATP-dependent helicase/nuclease subunit B
VAARPRALSVTRIERWMRDPYDIFASRILKLNRLEPIDAALGPADFGRYIHSALDRFMRDTTGALPDDALARLLAIGREEMAEAESRPGLWAFLSLTEIAGRLELDAPAGPFILTATADRIDIAADGAIEIIDYKTGILPNDKEVAAGFSPQLPLEAAIARAGGFAGIDGARLGALSYWRLSGNRSGGEIRSLREPAEALAAQALAGLARLVAVFDRAETPYPARPAPEHAPRYSDYEHLARVGEWSAHEREERW